MGTKKLSAGILLFKQQGSEVEVFLVHPGGPFWSRKDEGAWSIPKGEYEAGEDPLAVAIREFQEETGFEVKGTFHPLTTLKQPSGKVISGWAVEGDVDAAALTSNTFTLEWPPKSGKSREFPEVDRGAWFDLSSARVKLQAGQRGFLDRLELFLHDDAESDI
ncbi:MAG: Phosphohydrolase [Nitrospira sp.]|jgi:predicted NUDIX family NTP pyrophosphohydrolase|nr:Phosphohydrolase [Nitrospira sp.]